MPVITKPNQHFDATLYTGNGTSQSITNVNFAPDFTWIKDRTLAWNNKLFDSVRGSGKYLISDNTAAEATDATQLSAFLSNGFSVGSQVSVNGSGDAYVSWNWKAGGTAVTNTSGSITSQVSVNTTAGFSIVSYASGSAGQKTVGHGLGVTPSMIITKSRDNSSYNWSIYHSSVIDTTSKFLRFTTDAIVTSSTIWGAALPNTTVFGITSDNGVPANNNCIAYCWAPVAGYSAFGSYTGNGSTDGPFIYTGFKPKFIMIKATQTVDYGYWEMYDTSRSTYNVLNKNLYANYNYAEDTDAAGAKDVLSNGFKLRGTVDNSNGNGKTYIYAAFAEAPFKYANAR